MSLLNPADTLERQNAKLQLIAQSLMRRVEQQTDQSGLAYQQFERAALLESQVRERTADLERTLDLLQESNARLEVANAETETARANLTEALETINEGFALFDPDDRLVLSNSRFCRDLQDISQRLNAGLRFADYVTLVSNSRFLALPEGSSPADWVADRLRRHRDDHVVFNVSLVWDRWLQVSEHRTARGGTVILQTDVTDIIRLERQERDRMRDQQARMLQATLDHLNQGVCIFDAQTRLVGWNKRMDGLLAPAENTDPLGETFAELLDGLQDQLHFAPEFDAAAFKVWAQGPGERRPIVFEVTRGDNRILSVLAREMPDRGFVISFTDVTAERAASRSLAEMNELLERRVRDRTEELGVALAEAERANASKSRFVAAASHDLLQPLSAAKLFLSTLADRVVDEDALTVIGKTETALLGVEQIIEALLDISRLDAGKAVFKVQPIRLAQIFSPLRDELSPGALAKGLRLHILDSRLTVRSDPGYLRRIVQNLLSNAVRYTDTGRVLLGVRRRGGMARIEVHDTGRGIAEADQQTIFEEFARLDPARKDAGLGLGLAIVERACNGLGHKLSLVSRPGRGSCFALEVPIMTGGAEAEAAIPIASLPPEEPLDGLVLLLVENDVPLAGAMTMMIEGFGAKVIHAHGADEALAILDAIQLVPDALLLDFQLGGGMTAIELYGVISARYGDVPTAIISADRSPELRRDCERLALRLMAKPIDRSRLQAFLGELTRQ